MFGANRQAALNQLTAQLTESREDVEAVTEIVRGMETCTSPDEAIGTALALVRERFHWAYGSFWQLDATAKLLRFAQESGTVTDEFRRVTPEAAFAEGVGLSGRAWRSRELVYVRHLADLTDCVRAPAATRAGVRGGICFPVIENGQVVGTMDFFSTEDREPSEGRLAVLRTVGVLDARTFEEAIEQHARYTVDLLRERSPLIDAAVRAARLTVVPARYSLCSGLVTEAQPVGSLQPA